MDNTSEKNKNGREQAADGPKQKEKFQVIKKAVQLKSFIFNTYP